MSDRNLKIKITVTTEPKTLEDSANGSPFGDVVIFTHKKKFIKPTTEEIIKNMIEVIQYDPEKKEEKDNG